MPDLIRHPEGIDPENFRDRIPASAGMTTFSENSNLYIDNVLLIIK
jgi:hypothetical protein